MTFPCSLSPCGFVVADASIVEILVRVFIWAAVAALLLLAVLGAVAAGGLALAAAAIRSGRPARLAAGVAVCFLAVAALVYLITY